MKNNPELAKALAEAAPSNNCNEIIKGQIDTLSTLIGQDSFLYRGSAYSRKTYTAAGLLCLDSDLRTLAVGKGIDVRAFDNIVGQVQQLILETTNKPAPGAKVATSLRKFCGI